VSNFGDIKGKQWGIMLYTRANYTSITDPVSGRRKNLYLKKGKGEEMRKQILNFTAIGYDEQKSAFYFEYDPKKFTDTIAIIKGYTKRKVRSNVERWRWDREKQSSKEIKNITEQLKTLFKDNSLTISADLLSQIKEKSDLPANFYSELIWLIEAIMQIRNSDNKGNDFILSPVLSSVIAIRTN
jgi:CRISPR-associated protein Cpf1